MNNSTNQLLNISKTELQISTLPFISTISSTLSTSIDLSTSPTFDEPPVEDWCFNLIIFYRSISEDDAQALKVLQQLETYAFSSYKFNY